MSNLLLTQMIETGSRFGPTADLRARLYFPKRFDDENVPPAAKVEAWGILSPDV